MQALPCRYTPPAYRPFRYAFLRFSLADVPSLRIGMRLFPWCLALGAGLLAAPVQAQPTTSGGGAPVQTGARPPVMGGALASVPLEGVLGADYRVGPGDVFLVTLGGAAQAQSTIPVSADGRIVVPQAGAIDVEGLSIDAARGRIVGQLSRFYRNVDAALVQPRSFLVSVSGAVYQPGRKVVSAVGRLDDAVAQAMATDSAYALSQVGTAPALRSVRLERRGGMDRTYDLLRYRRMGDLDHNPRLLDGDNVVVALFDEATGSVRVSGDVAFPGVYEWRPGDRVEDLMAVADGAPRTVEARTVRVGSAEPVRLADALAGRAPVPAIRPGTEVYVEGVRDLGTVTVTGEVRFPGAYRIEQSRTTLRDVLARAGGLRPTALARAAYVLRAANGERNAAARAVSTPGDLPFVERAALADQAWQNRVVLSESALAGGPGADLPLFAGDQIVVPRDEGTVLVVGAVARPGYVPAQPGGSVDAYLAAAGGRRRDARETYVVLAGTQAARKASDEAAPLASGDAVLVTSADPATRPELFGFQLQEQQVELQREQDARAARAEERHERREERQIEQERRTARYQLIGAITAAGGVLASLLVALILRS